MAMVTQHCESTPNYTLKNGTHDKFGVILTIRKCLTIMRQRVEGRSIYGSMKEQRRERLRGQESLGWQCWWRAHSGKVGKMTVAHLGTGVMAQ